MARGLDPVPALRRPEGAVAVELALVLPVLFSLVMGLISGGVLYNRLMALNHASREAARLGATLPTGKVSVADSWLDQVGARAVSAAGGDLDAAPDRYTCVAYVGHGSPETSTQDFTRRREQTGTGAAVYTNGSLSDPATWCFDDERGTTGERRVQVVARRDAKLEAFFFSMNVTLSTRSAARFEAVSP